MMLSRDQIKTLIEKLILIEFLASHINADPAGVMTYLKPLQDAASVSRNLIFDSLIDRAEKGGKL